MITSLSVNTGGLGRTGNQMFTIASAVGIAIKNGQPYGFPDWINRDALLFGGTADKMEDYFINPLSRIPEGLQFQDIPYHWEYRDYNVPTGNWNICSHLQDPRYFEHCMPVIRGQFRMKHEPEQNDYVAIHYRAGDYIDDPNAYHPRCSKEYYEKALSQFHVNQKYLLFSDDPAASINTVPIIPNQIVNASTGNYLQDFALMKRCKSFITANSSFSYFAALLGEHPDKKIVMPSRWFGTAANGMRFEGYHKEAIVI